MLSRKREYQSIEATAALWHVESNLPEADNCSKRTDSFYGQFADCMEMYADAQTVAEYQRSPRWFPLRSPNESGTLRKKWLR